MADCDSLYDLRYHTPDPYLQYVTSPTELTDSTVAAATTGGCSYQSYHNLVEHDDR